MKSQYFLNITTQSVKINEVSPNDKHDLQKFLAWFIIDYFTHNFDLTSQPRKTFRLQISTDDTIRADQSDYVWDPEWSYPLFHNIPTDISSQSIGTISIDKNLIRVFPLTTDATTLNYNSFLPKRTGNTSLF